MDGRMDEWKEGVSEWEGEGGKKVSARVKLEMIRANMEDASSGHSLKKRTNNELLLHSQLLSLNSLLRNVPFRSFDVAQVLSTKNRTIFYFNFYI